MKRYKSKFKEDHAWDWLIDDPLDDEMISHFYKRTDEHRELVAKYGYKLARMLKNKLGYSLYNKLCDNIKWHDLNKYKSPLIEPYVLISWNYKCKDDKIDFKINDHDNAIMNKATEWHVKHEKHHPEFWSDRENVIPKNDQDKFDPESVPTIEIHNMPFIYLCEMVADWCAMSEEKGTNTPKEWADKVLNKRWKFSEKQTKQIYILIDLAWN